MYLIEEYIDEITCIYCKSSKVIRHGTTSKGHKRYRCRNCSKTWIQERKDMNRPDISDVVESYLSGKTYRELVDTYKSSPLRINQKIREFLEGCPDWEDFLDACVINHDTKLVYLIGKNFSCSIPGSKNNTMYVAMAVEALSSMVLGFEIGLKDSRSVWQTLLTRLDKRGIFTQTFMTNGSKHIEEAVLSIYPDAHLRIYYHSAYRDQELMCCLNKLPINIKLINDALTSYESMNNQNLNNYLQKNFSINLNDFLQTNPELFTKRLKERLDSRPKIRIEGLTTAFQTRFEKFHMLKEDPYPLVNGWIAKTMISQLDSGFSRLTIYSQLPARSSFKLFSCGQKPVIIELEKDSAILKTFVIEIAARCIQVPIFYSKCNMTTDSCSLF